MPNSFLRRALVAALSITLALTSTSASPSPFNQDATVLKPLNVDVFEQTAGLKVRSSIDYSRLSLEDQAHMVYGSQGDDGQLLLANMTLYAPNGLKVILMELFDGLTSSVDCQGDDGQMSLTFSSKEAFDFAVQEWSWINANDTLSFLLIADHDGCGPDEQRQAYTISYVTESPDTLTTLLAAAPAPWSEVAGTYDLDFGKFQAPPAVTRRMLAPRGFFSDIINDAKSVVGDVEHGVVTAADDVGSAVASIGNADISKSISFGIGVGTPGKSTTLLATTVKDLSVTVDCVDCFLAGSFKLTGHLSVKNFIPQDLVLTGSPSGVNAALELETILQGSVDGPSGTPFSADKQLFEQGVPGAGIAIPEIFSLGAVIEFAVEVSSSASGIADFTVGLTASMPDSAIVTTDLLHPERSSQSGFDGSTITPVFQIKQLNGTITVEAAAVPKLTFGIDIAVIGKLEASLALKLPSVAVDLDAFFDQNGACSQEPGAPQTGVNVTATIGASLDVSVDETLFGSDHNLFNKTLFDLEKDLFKHCYAVDIGLDAAKNLTTSTKGASSTNGTYIGSPAGKAPVARPKANSPGAPYRASSPTSTSTATSSSGSPYKGSPKEAKKPAPASSAKAYSQPSDTATSTEPTAGSPKTLVTAYRYPGGSPVPAVTGPSKHNTPLSSSRPTLSSSTTTYSNSTTSRTKSTSKTSTLSTTTTKAPVYDHNKQPSKPSTTSRPILTSSSTNTTSSTTTPAVPTYGRAGGSRIERRGRALLVAV